MAVLRTTRGPLVRGRYPAPEPGLGQKIPEVMRSEASSSRELSVGITTLDFSFIRRSETINGAPSHCSGFPASSAASRHSGRSDRSRSPNEGEENRRVGGLIGYTWKTTVSSLKCKTGGRGRRDRLGVPSHLFPSDSEGGGEVSRCSGNFLLRDLRLIK